jgi:hypothetical protein
MGKSVGIGFRLSVATSIAVAVAETRSPNLTPTPHRCLVMSMLDGGHKFGQKSHSSPTLVYPSSRSPTLDVAKEPKDDTGTHHVGSSVQTACEKRRILRFMPGRFPRVARAVDRDGLLRRGPARHRVESRRK